MPLDPYLDLFSCLSKFFSSLNSQSRVNKYARDDKLISIEMNPIMSSRPWKVGRSII